MWWFILGATLGIMQFVGRFGFVRLGQYAHHGIGHPFQGLLAAGLLGAGIYGTTLWAMTKLFSSIF